MRFTWRNPPNLTWESKFSKPSQPSFVDSRRLWGSRRSRSNFVSHSLLLLLFFRQSLRSIESHLIPFRFALLQFLLHPLEPLQYFPLVLWFRRTRRIRLLNGLFRLGRGYLRQECQPTHARRQSQGNHAEEASLRALGRLSFPRKKIACYFSLFLITWSYISAVRPHIQNAAWRN